MIQEAIEAFREAAEHDAKPLKLTWTSWKKVLSDNFPPEAYPPDEVCDDLKTYLTKCLFDKQMNTPFVLFSYSQMLEEMKDEFFGGAAEKSYFLIGDCSLEFACVDWRTGTVYIIHGGGLAEREYVKEKRYKSLKTFLLAHVEENKELVESGRESQRLEAEFEEASKIDPNAVDEYGFTQYHRALLKGDLEKAKQELDHGARLGMPTRDGRTPLQIAAARGYTDILRLLLDRGCDPNQRGSGDNPPLFNAANSKSVEIYEILIDAGADPTLESGDGRSLLAYTINQSGGNSELTRFLLEQGADPNGHLYQAKGPLLGLMLEFGADPMEKEGQVVRFAVSGNKFDRLKLLVDAGADLASLEGLALSARSLEMLKFLGEAGVDLDQATGNFLMRPLIHTAGAVLANTREEREAELAKTQYLLDQGADPNTPDSYGKTPLMHAAENKNYKAITLLLAHGADPTAESERGWTAVEYATQAKCRKSVIKEIEKAIQARESESD